ncbi:family S53 protease [Mycena olivaceomarginata]|nr:family S53 protease [Mycena olivaceomarginata]
MVLLRATFLATFVALATATPTGRQALVVHEHRVRPAQGFVSTGPAPSDEQLTLRIALNPNNIAGLENELYAVSDPSSSRYGQHLTPEEARRCISAAVWSLTRRTGRRIRQALLRRAFRRDVLAPDEQDLCEHHLPRRRRLQFEIPVSQANSLLNTEFSVFSHKASVETSIRTLQYSLPAEVSQHVAYQPKPQPLPTKNSKRDIDPTCADITTISCLRAEYGLPTTPATQTNNVLGVSGYTNQFANFNDLKLLDGGSNTQLRGFAGVEASLDIEFISVGPLNNDVVGGFLDQINALINDTSRPTVLTTSYGFDEEDLTLPVAQGLCNAYAQLGALGTSILFASGDGGVGGNEFECTTFVPTAPSTCPWVTSVGASQTILENFTKNNFSEIGAAFSSGGFSNYFEAPAYQKGAVDAYVANLDGTYSGLFNTTGRGGVNFEIIAGNSTFLVSGTSASSPVFASVIALLNDELIAAGKSPLGFLNPFLYSPAGRAALNEVTVGKNPGCGTPGFNATAGWDPVTGLGSPNYAQAPYGRWPPFVIWCRRGRVDF